MPTTSNQPAPGGSGPRQRGRHFANAPLRSRRLRWLSLASVAVLLLVVGTGGFLFLRLRSNVATEALNLGDTSDTNLADGPLDILVIGSDTRSGSNANYGDAADQESGARSDVMMLVQISEDRSNVSVVSFPRDLMGTIPKCTSSSGKVYPKETDVQINQSLENGGAGCTVATISAMTGVKIDHFMLVDFNAVKQLSNVVGGVEVCVNKAINDSYSGLNIPAGTSEVQGEQALAFLRSRHGFGDGSDTGRIKAQQAFLSSLLRKVKSEGTLTNPTKLYNIADAITQNVTVDSGFTDISTLMSVGQIIAGVDLSKITFATVPTEPYVNDSNKLQLSASAKTVFQRLRNDQSLTEPASSASSSASASSTSSLDRSVKVTVINGSGSDSVASQTQSTIKKLGYTDVSTETASTTYDGGTVYYSSGYQSQAEEIADKLGITSGQVQENDQYEGVAALVGTAEESASATPSASASAIAGGASGQTANQSTCQQAYEY